MPLDTCRLDPRLRHTHSRRWSELWRMNSERSDVGGGEALQVHVCVGSTPCRVDMLPHLEW